MDDLRRKIYATERRNYAERSFYPNDLIRGVMTEDSIRNALLDNNPTLGVRIPIEHVDSAVRGILQGAQRIFGILVLIRQASLITKFIESDNYQPSGRDNGLPFPRSYLNKMFRDSNTSLEFFNKQWSFSAPIFSRTVFVRSLEKKTVLPFTINKRLGEGAFGEVFDINIPEGHYMFSHSQVTPTYQAFTWPQVLTVLSRRLFARNLNLRRRLKILIRS